MNVRKETTLDCILLNLSSAHSSNRRAYEFHWTGLCPPSVIFPTRKTPCSPFSLQSTLSFISPFAFPLQLQLNPNLNPNPKSNNNLRIILQHRQPVITQKKRGLTTQVSFWLPALAPLQLSQLSLSLKTKTNFYLGWACKKASWLLSRLKISYGTVLSAAYNFLQCPLWHGFFYILEMQVIIALDNFWLSLFIYEKTFLFQYL